MIKGVASNEVPIITVASQSYCKYCPLRSSMPSQLQAGKLLRDRRKLRERALATTLLLLQEMWQMRTTRIPKASAVMSTCH